MVTKDFVQSTAETAAAQAALQASVQLDAKQSEQIKKLRYWCAGLTVVTVISLLLHLL